VSTDLSALVSADVGVVNRVDESVAAYDHPRLACYFSQSCDPTPLFGVPTGAASGGIAADRATARAAAIGEAIERYSASYVPESRLLLTSQSSLMPRRPTVPPDWPDRSTGCQDVALHWLLGTTLGVPGAPSAWVPAHRVYLNGIDSERGVATATSTGLACHTDPWRALRAGLLEVIERDAVMVSWLTRATPQRLVADLRWRDRHGIDVRFDRAVEEYRLYLLSGPTGVPVVFAVARGNRNQPAVAVGAAAHPDLVIACRKALIEAQQTFSWARHMLAQSRPIPPRLDVTDLEDHVAYYLDPDRLGAFDFLDVESGAPSLTVDLDRTSRPDDPEADVHQIVADARRTGIESFSADVTAPDVRAAGAWVIRAIMPALYPLTVGYEHRRGHPRLRDCDDLNADPHPFP
jgi:ribosomal protein S12 methylthiotransferase accessory factor